MKPPILENNKHSVVAVEFNTGIVLKTDFERHIGQGEAFHIFENLELAIKFVDRTILEDSDLQLSIYNNKGEYLFTKDKNGKT
ncbi:hypothetical protein [Tenacibaculum sp. SDUM215027]|uniref:hypothetical protein n=1 Tax=Tenacibaculum sp. SDUM215027 TaxID=3422596 RepID=UPI003D311154